MENKKDKIALNEELLDKVSGGIDFPTPEDQFYHFTHDDLLYGCLEDFSSRDPNPQTCPYCGRPMHSN